MSLSAVEISIMYMARKPGNKKASSHVFSIELVSRDYVKCLIIPTDDSEKVLIEGFLGDLEESGMVEGVMLEIVGSNGTLKMDLSENELLKLIKVKTK